jgi:hypothetical protein
MVEINRLTNAITRETCHTIIAAESLAQPHEKIKAKALTVLAKEILLVMGREERLRLALEEVKDCLGRDYWGDKPATYKRVCEALSSEYPAEIKK